MPTSVDDYVYAVIEMEKEGIYVASCIDIAERNYNGKRVPIGLVQDVQKCLRKIQTKLRKFGYLAHCSGPNYHQLLPGRESFIDVPPQTLEECQYVSPIGKSRGQNHFRYGIVITHDKYDLYFQYMNRFHVTSSSISTREGSKRWIEGSQAGHVPMRTARKGMKTTINTIIPPNISQLGDLSNGDSDEGGLLGPAPKKPKKS